MAGGDKMLTVGLSTELHRELKLASVMTGCSMKDIVMRAIRRELAMIRSDLKGAGGAPLS